MFNFVDFYLDNNWRRNTGKEKQNKAQKEKKEI